MILVTASIGGGPLFVENKLLVLLDYTLTETDIDLILIDDTMTIERQISRPLNLWLIKVDLGRLQLHDAKRSLQNFPEVLYVQFDHYLNERVEPDDTFYDQQWNFENIGQTSGTVDADIDAADAWDITTGGLSTLGGPLQL